jgi:hypothetical protein
MKVFLVLAMTASLAEATYAVPVRWDLQDVTFDDGATASGFFFLDSSITPNTGLLLTKYDIKVTAGPNITAFEYSSDIFQWSPDMGCMPCYGNNGTLAEVSFQDKFVGSRYLLLSSQYVTNGVAELLSQDNFQSAEFWDADPRPMPFERQIIRGSIISIVAVPEPSFPLFVGVGLAGLIFAARLRKPR